MAANSATQSDLGQALAGDSLALQKLLVKYFTPLERHIAAEIPRELQTIVAAEDVLQDAFSQVYRDIASFQGNGTGQFFAWVRTIADHRLADAVKAQKRLKRGGEHRQATNHGSSVLQLVELVCVISRTRGSSVMRRETAQAVQVQVAALPEDQREAIRARYFRGLEVADIADEMDRSPGAIRGLLHRAHQKLAELLGGSSRWIER